MRAIRGIFCIFVIYPSRSDYFLSPITLADAICVSPAQTPCWWLPGANEIELRWKRENKDIRGSSSFRFS